MATSRIDFAALGRARRVEPVVLIAGAPLVLTVGGTRPTSTAVSSGTVDALWWPGTGTLTQTFPDGSTWDPVRDLLDPRTVWTLRSAMELLKGDITVEPLPIDLLDRGGAATAILSRRSAATGQLLTAELSSTDTTATLATTVGFDSGGGVAHMGREAIGYAGKTSTTLTGLTRGLFGSTALAHRTGSRRGMRDPLVTSGALPRYLQGRRAMVFLCRVSDDGATLYDPTLVFSGIVGAGAQLVSGGARWQVTLDPTTEVLSRAPSLPVELYGWHHLNSERGYLSPLTGILGGMGPAFNGGWSPNIAAVVARWNNDVRPLTGLSLSEASGRLLVHNNGSVNDPAPITSFLDPQELSIASGATAHFATAPDTCLVLEGYLKLRADDFGRIPSTLSIAVTDPAPGSANVALIADTDETEHFAAFIATRDPLTNTIQLAARSTATARERVRASRITRRTTAQVGLIATGPHCVGALRALAAALVEMGGGDDFAGTIDWDRIAAVFRSVPSVGIPEGREYELGSGDDSFLSLLVDEARLRGCTLTVRAGRLSIVRAASFALSEAVGVVEITAGDLLVAGTPPRRLPVEVVDQPEPACSTVSFELRDGGTIRYTDDTFAAEFGSSKAVACKALRWLPATTDTAAPRELPVRELAAAAQQILGVLGEPQRIVKVPLGPRFFGLEPGDLVLLTHDEVPAWDGTRGVTGAVCQVDAVDRSIFGGQAQVTASLRLGETGIGGYAPAALVAAGGLSGMSTTVSLDTSTAFGASCFAPPGESPVYGFAAGDVVVLSQYDAAAITVTEITRTIVSVDPVAHTIVLDVAPSAGMVAQAASAYGVVLRTAPWTSATAAPVGDVPAQQARFAFAADAATGAFSDGSDPKRWAA